MTLALLPTRATPAQAATYARRVRAAWNAATPDQRARGASWYPSAQSLATMIADGNTAMGAAVIAAMSAQKSWPLNVRLATEACAGRVAGHTSQVLAKVARILAGVDPALILPMRLKTGHFWRNICDPTDPHAVTIDRHAHDVVAGGRYGDATRGLSCVNRYDTIADAYRRASRTLGVVPSTLQAGVWLYWIEAGK